MLSVDCQTHKHLVRRWKVKTVLPSKPDGNITSRRSTNPLNFCLKKTPWGLGTVQVNQHVFCPSRSSSVSRRSSPDFGPAGGLSASAPTPLSFCCGIPAPCSSSDNMAAWALTAEQPPCVCPGPESTTPSRRRQENCPGSLERATRRTTSLLGASEWLWLKLWENKRQQSINVSETGHKAEKELFRHKKWKLTFDFLPDWHIKPAALQLLPCWDI